MTKITFQGLTRFTEQQVIAASGLRLDQPATLQDIEAAAKRLAHSGAFENVSYRYRAGNDEMMVEFQVEVSKKFMSCIFDNFVWLSPQEILDTLHREVPLYDNFIPEGGESSQQVKSVLVELLRAHGVSAGVDQLPFFDMKTKRRAILFRATGVSLPIRALNFPGASALSEPALQKAAKELLGQDYSASSAEAFVRVGILPLYTRRGFLRAHFSDPHPSVASQPEKDASIAVVLEIPVEEGPEFFWDGVEWSGYRVLQLADLNSKLAMKSGEVADGEKIGRGFDAVRDAYGSLGYIRATLLTQQILDDPARRVHFRISIVEGAQYHMGVFSTSGLSSVAASQLMRDWKLKPGDVYSASYPNEFMNKSVRLILVSEGPRCGSMEIKYSPDAQKTTVDVQIACH